MFFGLVNITSNLIVKLVSTFSNWTLINESNLEK